MTGNLDSRLIKKLLLDNLHKMQFVQICNEKGIENCEVEI